MNSAKITAKLVRFAVYLAAGVTLGTLLLLVAYILWKGVPHITLDMFQFEYSSDNVSLFPALINTLTVTGVTLLLAVPLGIFSAIYLVEYAKKGSKLVGLVSLTTETLQGIPSIVYGLFGYLFFVSSIFKSLNLLSGSLTLAIMILPIIMRTTQEALKSIPDSLREASFGLGAGNVRTIFRIVLPAAAPGIFAGIILAVGRIVGETAALIYTAGTVAQIPESLLGSGRTLSVHMYALWNEGLNTEQSYATAVILLVSVMVLNGLSDYLQSKIARKVQ